MHYWLMKSEPSAFSLEDLRRAPRGTEPWDGVRNYQARNFIRGMCRGDLAFFYHSNCAQPGVVGTMEIVREAYPDPTARDPQDPHYDPKATSDNPRWYMVDVRYRKTLRRPVPLPELKQHPALAKMPLVQRGNRLSVMPVTKAQWDAILRLGES